MAHTEVRTRRSGRTAPVSAEAPPVVLDEGGPSRPLSTVIPLLLFTLVLPSSVSIYLGPFRLSPYRIILLVSLPYLLITLLSNHYGRVTASDRWIIAAAIWMVIAMALTDGAKGIESGGITFAETFGAFLIGRCLVRTPDQWIRTVTMLGIGTGVLSLFTVAESVSHRPFIAEFFQGKERAAELAAEVAPRFGFMRARGPFDHPILLGVCAAAVTIALWHVSSRLRSLRVTMFPFCLAAALSSVSSGAVAALMVGVVLGTWRRITKSMTRRRWTLLIGCFIAFYFLLDFLSNRSGMAVLLSYFTFSSSTAYGRMVIWEWGFHYNALRNPWFGLGLIRGVDWVRPSYIGTSMDNYFLYLMVIHGMPTAIFLLIGIILRVRSAARLDNIPSIGVLAMSWWVPMVGTVVSAWTVHLWNQALVFFWFLLGAGGWCEAIRTSKDRPR